MGDEPQRFSMERLTGSELLAHYAAGVKSGMKKSELATSAGYVKTKPDGTTSIQYTAFSDALLAAKGLAIGKGDASKRGRELSYETAVLGKGHAVIGQGYLSQVGAEPGGRLSIKVEGSLVILEAVDSGTTEAAAA